MEPPNVKDLLLAERLERSQVAALLSPFGLRDPLNADRNLQSMAREPSERQLLAEILESILHAASQSADPDQALNFLERFSHAALNPTRLFSYLQDSPQAADILMRTLGGSAYMAEILIRDPHHFYWVTDPQTLQKASLKRPLEREIVRALRVIAEEPLQLDFLRSLKRREMLRIGVRDLFRFSSVEETLAALSLLAEVLISAAVWICSRALRRELGLQSGTFADFTVLGMGKLGGRELNFSSDVDLLYVFGSGYDAPAVSTQGALTAQDFFRRLAQKVTVALNDLTGEGYVYRVDLRLRPEGDAGEIAQPLDGFERYYRSRVGTWERLALLKAWPVAGSRRLGREFIEMARGFVFDRPFDLQAIQDVRNVKRKIDQKMTVRQQRTRNVKLGTGGIREIELIVQALQVRFGAGDPDLAERNTLRGLAALRSRELISAEEASILTGAYVFLRDVENKLQMADDAQTHSLPRMEEALASCARRLGYGDGTDGSSTERFLRDYARHTRDVSRTFEGIFGERAEERFSEGTRVTSQSTRRSRAPASGDGPWGEGAEGG